MDPSASSALARQEAEARLRDRLWRFLPGDEQRRLRIETHFEHEALELVLVPIWCFVLRHARSQRVERVLVNGRTGKVHGRGPFDWIRLLTPIVGAPVCSLPRRGSDRQRL